MIKKIVWFAVLVGAIFIGCQEQQVSVPFEHSIVLSFNDIDLRVANQGYYSKAGPFFTGV